MTGAGLAERPFTPIASPHGGDDEVTKYRIEGGEALDLMDKAVTRLEKLDGLIAADPKQGRDASARNAVISKELLYIAHLCRKAETLVLDQYHAFKGEGDHI